MSEPKITKAHHGGARHGSNGAVKLVVIHDEEFPESDGSAEQIAAYFAQPKHGASCAHYVEDAEGEEHCVPDGEVAYHAPPNQGSIGIERDGYSSWSRERWLKPKAQKTTCRVAARTAELCVRFDLPPIWRGPDSIRAGAKGVTSHANKSKAFGQSDHRDPGPAFPVTGFMELVKRAHRIFADPALLRDFQKKSGLTPDGDAGSRTMNAMTEWLNNTATTELEPNKTAPVVAPKPVEQPAQPVDEQKENDVDFKTLYRVAGGAAVFALTTDGSRVWLDAAWYKALVARKVLDPANIVELPANSTVFSLPLKGQAPPA